VRRYKNHRPVSKFLYAGIFIFFAGTLLSVLTDVSTPLIGLHQARVICGWLRWIGGFSTALGVVRTIFLRRKRKMRKAATDAAGLLGERQTADVLLQLDGSYRVFHRIFLYRRGVRQEFDHIVVGRHGVFHIESKNWKGDIDVSDHGVRRSVAGDFHDPIDQMKRHQNLITELLRDNGVVCDVTGILCFTNRHANLTGHSSKYKVIRLDSLLQTIHRQLHGPTIGKDEAERIAHVIQHHSQKHA